MKLTHEDIEEQLRQIKPRALSPDQNKAIFGQLMLELASAKPATNAKPNLLSYWAIAASLLICFMLWSQTQVISFSTQQFQNTAQVEQWSEAKEIFPEQRWSISPRTSSTANQNLIILKQMDF